MREATRTQDPHHFVTQPIVAALNRIVVAAMAGFALVAGAATFPLLFRLDLAFHDAFHFVVPAGWVLYAAIIGALLLLRRPPAEPDVWSRASEADPALARLARRSSAAMTIGWVISFFVILAHHHLTSPRDVFVTAGIIVPLTFVAWLLAVLAWNAWCRATLARGERESAGRLRRYWSGLPQARELP